MARKADPNQFLARLEAAIKKAKPRHVVGAVPMASIVGLSWRHFHDTHVAADPDLPIRKRGGPGVDYEFEVVKVLRHLIAQTKKRIAAEQKSSAELMRLTGITVEGDEQPKSMRDMRDAIETQLMAHKAKKDQGDWMPVARMTEFMEGFLFSVMDGLLGEGARIDPTGQLPPPVREAIEEDMRGLAGRIDEKARAFIERWNAPTEPARITGHRPRAGR